MQCYQSIHHPAGEMTLKAIFEDTANILREDFSDARGWIVIYQGFPDKFDRWHSGSHPDQPFYEGPLSSVYFS